VRDLFGHEEGLRVFDMDPELEIYISGYDGDDLPQPRRTSPGDAAAKVRWRGPPAACGVATRERVWWLRRWWCLFA
jgi:hypothetical protein